MKVYVFMYEEKQIGETFLNEEQAMKNVKRIWIDYVEDCLEEWTPKQDYNNDILVSPSLNSSYLNLRTIEIDDNLLNQYKNLQDAKEDIIYQEE